MRYITLAIAFLICTEAEAQIIRSEPFYTAPEAAAVVTNLLLDSFPGAAVAYSLRKLDKDYTGSAIRVRRSSDNTEQDIGFVNNYLDTASMKTFVGANNGFVVTWYNQADSSGVFGIRNLSESTAANQPQIISSGALVLVNARPAVQFDATNDRLTVSNSTATFKFIHDGTQYFMAFVSRNNGSGSSALFGNNAGTTLNTGFYIEKTAGSVLDLLVTRSKIGIDSVAVYNTTTTSYNINTQYVTTIEGDSDNATASERSKIYINGSAANSNNTKTSPINNVNATHNFQLGTYGNNSGNMNGFFQEFVIYNSNQSSNRTAIRDNINSFYSIY